MPVISGGQILTGAHSAQPRPIAGAPVTATNEAQTLTIGGTPTGGTFKLAYGGFVSGSITWSSTNATLLSNINTALNAMPPFGTGGVVATAGTLTAGIGSIVLTFSGSQVAGRPHPEMTIAQNALTGTSPTLSILEMVGGVAPDGRGVPKGGLVQRLDTGVLYVNTGTEQSPTLVVVGSQT